MGELRLQTRRTLAYVHAALELPSTDALDEVRASATLLLADLRRALPTESASALEELTQLTMAMSALERKLSEQS